MIIEHDSSVGGHALGFDVPVQERETGVTFGPAVVRVGGQDLVLPATDYDIEPGEAARCATVLLVAEGEGVALLVWEQPQQGEGPELGDDVRGGVLATVATLWIPAGATSPSRARVAVITPGPPTVAEIAAGDAGRQQIRRPKSETDDQARARAGRLAVEARRRQPYSADKLGRAELDELVGLLARIHGLVE